MLQCSDAIWMLFPVRVMVWYCYCLLQSCIHAVKVSHCAQKTNLEGFLQLHYKLFLNTGTTFLSTLIQESKIFTIQFTILLFPFIIVARNRDLYKSNSEIHNINTRFSFLLTYCNCKLKNFPKSLFYFRIKVFNHLSTRVKKTFRDINKFRSVLKSLFIINSFYSEEYFAWNSHKDLGLV
jgi:hypothetical protein